MSNVHRHSLELKPTKLAVCGSADYTSTNLSTTLSKSNELAVSKPCGPANN